MGDGEEEEGGRDGEETMRWKREEGWYHTREPKPDYSHRPDETNPEPAVGKEENLQSETKTTATTVGAGISRLERQAQQAAVQFRREQEESRKGAWKRTIPRDNNPRHAVQGCGRWDGPRAGPEVSGVDYMPLLHVTPGPAQPLARGRRAGHGKARGDWPRVSRRPGKAARW